MISKLHSKVMKTYNGTENFYKSSLKTLRKLGTAEPCRRAAFLLLGGEARGVRLVGWVGSRTQERGGVSESVLVASFLGEVILEYLRRLFKPDGV